MKKLMCKLAVLCTAAALFCAFASAESAIETEAAEGYQSTVTMADVNQERVSVTVAGVEEGKQYLLIAQNADAAPTESNIIYINQDTSSGTSVSFEVFPKELETDKTYYVFLSSDASSGTITARALVGTFILKEAQEQEDKFGDVNQDGMIDQDDVRVITAHVLQKRAEDILTGDAFNRANLDGNEYVELADAMEIYNWMGNKPNLIDGSKVVAQ